MNEHGWQRKFEDPIPLPKGRQLVTLRGAADYITSLPKKESDLPEWQAAIEALMLVSRGGPTMLARIGVMKALNRPALERADASGEPFLTVVSDDATVFGAWIYLGRLD